MKREDPTDIFFAEGEEPPKNSGLRIRKEENVRHAE